VYSVMVKFVLHQLSAVCLISVHLGSVLLQLATLAQQHNNALVAFAAVAHVSVQTSRVAYITVFVTLGYARSLVILDINVSLLLYMALALRRINVPLQQIKLATQVNASTTWVSTAVPAINVAATFVTKVNVHHNLVNSVMRRLTVYQLFAIMVCATISPSAINAKTPINVARMNKHAPMDIVNG
jgi:hypothetical protein